MLGASSADQNSKVLSSLPAFLQELLAQHPSLDSTCPGLLSGSLRPSRPEALVAMATIRVGQTLHAQACDWDACPLHEWQHSSINCAVQLPCSLLQSWACAPAL